ncbi:MAG TPA: DUF5666 domain-containing protein [Ramlibacter sp.]|nr:DUF5666 domain-containing protein [Ramlibacter sp.]
MKRQIQEVRLLAFLCIAAALACNQGSTPRATIQGQVLAADGRPAGGLHASLAGTALLTSTDAAGQFSLNGAPTGPATIHVGSSASLGLPPLADGMVVRVGVRLGADGSAQLAGAPQAMLRGKVASITGRDFNVGGTIIRTDDDTQIRANGMGAGIDDRIVGEAADVDGSLQQDGSILARRINTALKGSNNTFEFSGAIERIIQPNQLVVAGRPVITNSSTKIEIADRDAYFSALSVGQKAEVKGLLQVDQSVLATSIEAQAAVAPPPAPRPVANAGPAQSVTSGALVTLDGSASTDPSGLPLSFQWTQASGLAVTLANANTARPSFTAPSVAFGSPAASLVFSLVVSDANGASAPATVTITVNAIVPAPIANAGPDQSVASGALVTLDGSGSSDPAGLPLAFAWTQASGPAVTLSGAATANPTFTAPTIASNLPAASLTFTLVVSDANASSAAASVTITVGPQPAPIANAGPDQAVASGAFVTLDGSASSDAAGLPITFAWTQTAGGIVTLSSATASNPSFTAPAVAFDALPMVLTFSLVVSDGNSSSAPSLVNVTVNPAAPPNPAPVANAGLDQSVASAAAVTLDGRGSFDPDGEAITFAWTQSSGTAVTLTGADTAQPSFSAPAVPAGSPAATLVFSLTVSDAHASSAPATVIVTVNPEATAFPPPPGTPPPASPNPTPLPIGGNGSNRFEVGAAQGLYLQDPAAGEPTVSGFVVVTLGALGGGLPGNAPADTVVTMNGVALLRDPKLNGNFFRLDPAGSQPSIGWGGEMVLVATATDPKDGKPIQRTLVLPCPNDIPVTSAPDIGSVITRVPSLHITSPSDITLNVGIPELSSIFPQVQLFGYNRATRTLAPSGAAKIIAPGPLDVTVTVTPTAADAYLLDLRWPGTWILDGQTGGFCGLAKRWTYAK